MSHKNQVIGSNETFTFRSLVLPFYIPAFLSSVGIGLSIPLLPLYAQTFNPHGSLAGVIVGMFGLGSLVANIPAGILSGKIGDRRTMIIAIVFQLTGAAGAMLAPSAFVLGAGAFALGASQALFFVSRLSFFRTIVPASHRGRALALIGGEYRLGSSIGPVIGGFIAGSAGYPMTFAGLAILSIAVFLMAYRWVPRIRAGKGNEIPEKSRTFSERTAAAAGNRPSVASSTFLDALRSVAVGVVGAFRGNGKIFATAGLAIVMLQLVRAGRSVVLPLWGSAIGLTVQQVGLTIGIMYMVEMLMFIPAGIIMDRFGRKWAAVPCLIILAVSMGLLSLAHGMFGYVLIAVVAGIGNGLGSGINMTLSTDFAPSENPGSFIGAWRFIVDGGTAGGPFIVGAVKVLANLGWTGIIIGGFAFAGAAVMAVGVKEPRGG